MGLPVVVLTGSAAHTLRDLLNEAIPERPDEVTIEKYGAVEVLVTIDDRRQVIIAPTGDQRVLIGPPDHI